MGRGWGGRRGGDLEGLVSGWVDWEGLDGGGTMFSPRWCGCEGAGFLENEAAETGAAVVGQVDAEGCHCG